MKGKAGDDPLHFLPTLPPTRTKPLWQLNPPSFVLHVDKLSRQISNRADAASKLHDCKYVLQNILIILTRNKLIVVIAFFIFGCTYVFVYFATVYINFYFYILVYGTLLFGV